jgi:pulcherriminic acid synthase
MLVAVDDRLARDFESFVAGDESVDRHRLFERCRDAAPIFHSPSLNAWVLSRYDDVLVTLKDEDRFATLREGAGAPVYGPAILQWRGREHQKKGGIVAAQLRGPKAIASIDDFVEASCDRLVDELPYDGTPVDLKPSYSMWIPLLVIGELMDVEEPGRFRDWYQDIAAGGVSSIGHPEKRVRAFEALEELGRFIAPLIEERRERPGDDLLSDLCVATYDDEPLPFEQIRAMAAFLLTAGVETTERALSSLLRHVFEDPERWQALREDPTLVPSVAAETLRVFSPVQGVTREALVDVEFHGTEIPAGDRFLVLLASANRDESRFDDPHEFRLDRFADDAERQFTAAGHILPFGAGRHYCMGSQLAKVEMYRGVEALLARVAGARFVDDAVPPDAGFLLRSPNAVPVVLDPA